MKTETMAVTTMFVYDAEVVSVKPVDEKMLSYMITLSPMNRHVVFLTQETFDKLFQEMSAIKLAQSVESSSK